MNRKLKNMKRSIAGCLSVILLMCCGCKSTEKKAPELLTPVTIGENLAKAQYEECVRVDYETGYVAMKEEQVEAPLSGQIRDIRVKPGDEVEQGDILLSFYMTEEEKKLAALQTELQEERERASLVNRLAEIEAEEKRAQREDTEDSYTLALEQWEDQEAELAMKQEKERQQRVINELSERIANLQAKINKAVVRAPISGKVTWVYDEAVIGRTVQENTPLVNISDPDQRYVKIFSIEKINYTERYTYEITEGSRTETLFTPLHSVRRSRFENADFLYAQVGSKKYELILPEETESKEIELLYFAEQEELPEVGEGVMIRAENNENERVLTIPKEAIHASQNKSFVYVMHNGERILTEVETGRTTAGGNTEIVKGIREGDIVCIKSENTMISLGENEEIKTAVAERGEIVNTLTMNGIFKYIPKAIVNSDIYPQGEIISRNLSDPNYISKGETILTLKLEPGNQSELNARELAYRTAVQEAQNQEEQYDREIQICEREIREGVPGAALKKEKLEKQRELSRLENDQNIRALKESWTEYQKLFQPAHIQSPCDGLISHGGAYSDGTKESVSYGERILNITYPEKYVEVDDWRYNSAFKTYCHPGTKIQITNHSVTSVATAMSCREWIPLDQGTPNQRELIRTQMVLEPEDPGNLIETRSLLSLERLRLDQVLTVDESAIYTEDNIRYVYVLEDGNIYRQHVVCGPNGAGKISILSGLTEGQTVIIP